MSWKDLSPVPTDSNQPLLDFGVFDIEARKWIDFVVMAYYAKTKKRDGEILEIFHTLHDFIDWCFTDDQPHDLLFAHNGGKYDFLFLFSELVRSLDYLCVHSMIDRGSGILSFKVSTFEVYDIVPKKTKKRNILGETVDGRYKIAKRTIEFSDSLALLSFSLKTLTENFQVESIKGEFDFKRLEQLPILPEVMDELIIYLKDDVRGLYQVLERFYSQPVIRSAGFAKTIASQSMKVFQNYLGTNIQNLHFQVDEFVRSSYLGGRTEIFNPLFKQPDEYTLLRGYDVNSLYPYIMATHSFPNRFKASTSRYHEDGYGFFDVEVDVPEMFIPPLGQVDLCEDKGGKFIFPVGRFRGTWTNMELNYAMTLGVKIRKVHSGMIFHEGGMIFKDYIETLYDLRKKSPKNSADNVIYKLLMNSLYGRFGLNRERTRLIWDNNDQGTSPFLEVKSVDGRLLQLAIEDVYLDNSFVNVAIPAWVTSGARIHMHKLFMQNPEKVYYTDTDSIYTTHKYEDNQKDLGALKLEDSGTAACFILPKTYHFESVEPKHFLWDENGEKFKTNVKIVMKGFSSRKTANFIGNDFELFLEGEMKLQTTNPAKIGTLKTALRKSKEFLVMMDEQPREIRSQYDKRRLVKRCGNWTTEPWVIKNRKIVNSDPKKEGPVRRPARAQELENLTNKLAPPPHLR